MSRHTAADELRAQMQKKGINLNSPVTAEGMAQIVGTIVQVAEALGNLVNDLEARVQRLERRAEAEDYRKAGDPE